MMGSGVSTAAYRGRQDSRNGQRAGTAETIQGRRHVGPTRDGETGWSTNDKSATTSEGVGGVIAPPLWDPSRKHTRGLVDECATVPSPCVVPPRGMSIRDISLRHRAALSVLDSSEFTDDNAMSRRRLRYGLLGSWTDTTVQDPFAHNDHWTEADRVDNNYDDYLRLVASDSKCYLPGQKAAASSSKQGGWSHKHRESKPTLPSEVWLSHANEERRRPSSDDEAMTKEEAFRWLSRSTSSGSCSPRDVDDEKQYGGDGSTILLSTTAVAPAAIAATTTAVAATSATTASPAAWEEEGEWGGRSWAASGRRDGPSSVSEAGGEKEGISERVGVAADNKLMGSLMCGTSVERKRECNNKDDDYHIRSVDDTVVHPSVDNKASRNEYFGPMENTPPAENPAARPAPFSRGRPQEGSLAINRAGKQQRQHVDSAKTTSGGGRQLKDNSNDRENSGNDHPSDGQASPPTTDLLLPAEQRNDRQGGKTLSKLYVRSDGDCPVSTRKPSRAAHGGSFSTSLRAAMTNAASLHVRSPSAPEQDNPPSVAAEGPGAIVVGKRSFGALPPLQLTIPLNGQDQPACQHRSPNTNDAEMRRGVRSSPSTQAPARTKSAWHSQSGLLNDDEWVQLADEEDQETEPSTPKSQEHPSPSPLTLSTKLKHQVSYRVTENGSILLSGFQSPIPQSGLAAATLQTEILAKASAVATRGGVDNQDPTSSTTFLAARTNGCDGAGGDDSMPAEGGQLVGSGTLGGVVTPMQERVVFLSKLGEGATGVVYRAFDLFDLRLVAVKVIPVNDQNKRRQLVQELLSLYDGSKARRRRASAAALSSAPDHYPADKQLPPRSATLHTRYRSWPAADDADNETTTNSASSDPLAAGSENILELIDVFYTKSTSTLSLVVEYMDGGSLQDLVNSGGCQDEETLGHMALQALNCLRYLHASKKIHRDLKPANVLLNRKGELKVADFGLTRTLEEGGGLVQQRECTDTSRAGVGGCHGTNTGTSLRETKEGRHSPRGGSKDGDEPFVPPLRWGTPTGTGGDGGWGGTTDRITTEHGTENEEEAADVQRQVGGEGGGEEGEKEGGSKGAPDPPNSNTPLNRAHTFVGTLTYMSPERISGDGYSYSSDIWSLGMSLLTTALGKLPLETKHGYWGVLHSVRDAEPPTLPDDGSWSPEFREFVDLCLQKDPALRADCKTLTQTAFIRRAEVTWESSMSSCDDLLLEGEIRETQTQELKGMLSTIAKHIKRLIMAAENRAVTGESPCPTARGGLGLIPATTISGAPSTPGRYDGGMSADVAICDGAGGGREALRRRVSASTVAKMANAEAAAGVLNASPKSTSNAPASNATDEVLARTRVLRRASSVRQLFLGTTRRGERLAYFSRQIGLPHDTVVACFEECVRTIEEAEETETLESI